MNSHSIGEVDLVLSGSGVNFCAHVGAVEALVESGLRIRSIVGVSGGAIVGAFASLMHPRYREMSRIAVDIDLSWLVNPTFFLTAVIRGYLYSCKRLDNYLKHFFGKKKLNELPIPLTTLAADIEKKELVVFSSNDEIHNGPSDYLFDAVRASFAAPTVLPPHLGLFDGGIINNIPVDFAVETCGADPERLVGVRVVPKVKGPEHKSIDTGGWKPRLVKILAKSVDTFISALDREHMEENADKVVFVPCPNSSFDFEIPKELRWYHFYTGKEKMFQHLKDRFGLDLDGAILHAQQNRRMMRNAWLEAQTREPDDFWH